MEEPGFSEVELREMVEFATTWRPSAAEGRFVLGTGLAGRPWEVVVVTAYRKSPA